MKARIWIFFLILLIILSCAKESTAPDDNLVAPSNLELEQIDSQCIKLTWQDNSSSEEGFRIDRKIDENEWEENYATLPTDTVNFYDEELDIEGNYSYRIYAFNEDAYSESIIGEIDFSHSDLHALIPQFTGQIDLFPNYTYNFIVRMENEYGELVNNDYEVWFKFLQRPNGMNLNNQVFGVGDSLSVMSEAGLAEVIINSGNITGTAIIEITAVNLNENWIRTVRNSIIVHSSTPEYFNITHSGINSGLDLSGGVWRIEIAAMINDEFGNPVDYGMAVWFSLPENPDWAVINSEAYVGNENANGDSCVGVAYTYLLYQGLHTNDTLNLRLETGYDNYYMEEIVLPIQFPIIEILAIPSHVDWWEIPDTTPEYQSTMVRVIVRDGQNNPIDNQEVVFPTTLGMPLEPDPPDTGDPYTGLTGVINNEHGRLYKEIEFFYQECPSPIPVPPGVISATINAQILSTNVSAQTTVILRRYVD